MAHSQFDQFLQEATYRDQDSSSTLDEDSFYGLYPSWCHVSHNPPLPEHMFWAAMAQRIDPGQCLRMKGPAAADHILNSYRAVVQPLMTTTTQSHVPRYIHQPRRRRPGAPL